MRKAVISGVLALTLGPAAFLLALGALLNPAAQASCLPTASGAFSSVGDTAAAVPETSHVVMPLPARTWVKTSGFGIRVHPVTGETKLHTGVDLAAPTGTHILAAADGRVVFAGAASGYGNLILIEHNVGGRTVATGYAHMYADGIHVTVGQSVTAGEYIADVGVTGYSTGPHLHFEVRPGGADGAPIDPEPWLASHGAVDIEAASDAAPAGCAATGGPASPFNGDDAGTLVDDPTTDGQITERTAHILAQIRANFPESSWACWSPRPGQPSEHSLGRACDGTFGNALGTAAAGHALDYGWQVTNWVKDNARTLGVEYVIWQGRIWSVARADEGWRKYDGGGMHDPNSVTGGHYDHLHWTAEPN